jgi:hypothetical protein
MADNNEWGDDDLDIPEDEGEETTAPVAETPAPEAVEAPATEAATNETPVEGDEDDGEEQEDQRDWTNITIPDSLPEANKLIMDLREKNPNFKRAFNNQVAQAVRHETKETIRTLASDKETLVEENLKLQESLGDLYWNRMSPEQRRAWISEDQARADSWAYYQGIKRQVADLANKVVVPAALRNAYEAVLDRVDQATLFLTEEDAAKARAYARSPQLIQRYADKPHELVEHIHEILDKRIQATHTSRVQTADPRQAVAPRAARNAQPAPASVRGNPALAKLAPDSRPRGGTSGGATPSVTDADLERMHPDEYDAMMDKLEANDFSDLKKRGILR